MQTSIDYKQCNLFAVFVCIFRIAERQRLSANDKQCNLFAVFVCIFRIAERQRLSANDKQCGLFAVFVCIFRIAERQRLSANDKQCNLFAVFVCFTASQKGKDFLPMTNSAIYLRCLSMGTTQVPVALQTTMGSSRKSHAESLISVRGTITLRASKLILRELLPIWVISPYASI